MSNNLRTRNGMPFNFVNGLKVRGMDIESLIPGIEGIPEAGSKYQFAGNGSNKAFTLPVTPYNKDAVDVYVKQLYVHPDDYTLVGDTVTLTEAPPAVVAGETYNVVIKVSLTTLNGYVNANRVSFEGENLDVVLQKSKPLANYSALRAYAGTATQVRITDPGIAGFFYYDAADTSSADNGGTVIVASNGKRWKRIFDGTVNVLWFMMPNQISDVRAGTASIDVTAAIQAALNYALGFSLPTGQHGNVYMPSGKYRITDTIQVWSHVNLVGEGTSSYSAGTTGTEIAWYGSTTGGTNLAAIITSADKDSDWSNASIKKISVANSTGTSTNMAGIRVRNPQNGSCIEDVFVRDFPGWQFLMYEPADRTSTPGHVVGATPAAWTTKNLYAIGGMYPIEVQAGGEPSTHMMWHCAPGASSSAGVKITRSPFATSQRSTICFIGSYVELSDTARDIPGWLWESDLPITFINCHTHHNGTSVTEAAWKYTFSTRNIPKASFINCTSWKMAKIYNFATAGISKAPDVLATPESFSMELNTLGSEINTTFGNPAVNAGLSSAVFHILGNSAFGNTGFVVPFRCVLVGFTARSSTSLTAGTATLVINKNGSTYVKDKTINSGESGFSVDYTIGTLITSAHVFESGDRVTMQITTAEGMLPTGYGLVATMFFKRLP